MKDKKKNCSKNDFTFEGAVDYFPFFPFFSKFTKLILPLWILSLFEWIKKHIQRNETEWQKGTLNSQ